MTETKVLNRWWVVLGAILIQLALGAIYAWSVFTKALTAEPYSFTKTQTQIIFSVGLATFAFVMVLAGRLQSRIPPRIVSLLGGLMLGLGYILARFVGTSFWGHVLTLGIVAGAGIGLAYVVPIAVGVRWFPDKKGMLTGLAVAGFGFGAFLWIQLAGNLGQLINMLGVANVFFVYGIIFAVLVAIGSIWMVNPPEGYHPPGWDPAAQAKKAAKVGGTREFSSFQMLRTPQFYMLWFMFVAGAMAGLMVIGVIKLFGIERLQAFYSTAGEQDALRKAEVTAELAMAIFFAIANGLGRIGWGIISDFIGRKASLVLMLISQTAVMAAFFWLAQTPTLFFLGACWIGFNFGGNFALFPAATADLFGNKNVGANYGWVFTSYGIGGIVGPILGGYFGDLAKASGRLEAWLVPFLVAAGACFLAT
ncbi:MAG TPA: OFA family MFS transporter, partial [Thermogutta sp.]|nr:OFA family MFS transporter [Thermogutta sp.]